MAKWSELSVNKQKELVNSTYCLESFSRAVKKIGKGTNESAGMQDFRQKIKAFETLFDEEKDKDLDDVDDADNDTAQNFLAKHADKINALYNDINALAKKHTSLFQAARNAGKGLKSLMRRDDDDDDDDFTVNDLVQEWNDIKKAGAKEIAARFEATASTSNQTTPASAAVKKEKVIDPALMKVRERRKEFAEEDRIASEQKEAEAAVLQKEKEKKDEQLLDLLTDFGRLNTKEEVIAAFPDLVRQSAPITTRDAGGISQRLFGDSSGTVVRPLKGKDNNETLQNYMKLFMPLEETHFVSLDYLIEFEEAMLNTPYGANPFKHNTSAPKPRSNNNANNQFS